MDCLNCGRKLNLKHDGCVCKHCGYYNRQAETSNNLSLDQNASFREITHEDIAKGKTTSLTHEHKEPQTAKVNKTAQYHAVNQKLVKIIFGLTIFFMVIGFVMSFIPFFAMHFSLTDLFGNDYDYNYSTEYEESSESPVDVHVGSDIVNLANGGQLQTYDAYVVTIEDFPLDDTYQIVCVPYTYTKVDDADDDCIMEVYMDADSKYVGCIEGDEMEYYMTDDMYEQYQPYDGELNDAGHFFFFVPLEIDEAYLYFIEESVNGFELYQMNKAW